MTTQDVFISYASQDQAIANMVCASLEKQGIPCWIAPRNILGGEKFLSAIVRAVNTSRVIVVIVSSHTFSSKYIEQEISLAFDRGIPIIPFRIEPVEPTDGMWPILKSFQWVDAFSEPRDEKLKGLAQTITALLESSLRSKPIVSTSEPIQNQPALTVGRAQPISQPPIPVIQPLPVQPPPQPAPIPPNQAFEPPVTQPAAISYAPFYPPPTAEALAQHAARQRKFMIGAGIAVLGVLLLAVLVGFSLRGADNLSGEVTSTRAAIDLPGVVPSSLTSTLQTETSTATLELATATLEFTPTALPTETSTHTPTSTVTIYFSPPSSTPRPQPTQAPPQPTKPPNTNTPALPTKTPAPP